LPHDEFDWLCAINKASVVINSDQGLLNIVLARRIARGIAKVIADGFQPEALRPSLVITFEPLLIAAAGQEVTLLHAGRSSQDMLATVQTSMLREQLLQLSQQLCATMQVMVDMAKEHEATIVPNYTNGVAAQPNSYGHYLLGHFAGFLRDAERLRQAYARLNLSPMGTTVLNGTGWPLDRKRIAHYLGFSAPVDNAYDAAQVATVDHPVEVASIVASMALHVGSFVQDVMTQYAQPMPWILLLEGGENTYVSSAMPQKRNPGLLNRTRQDASTAIAQSMAPVMRAHNIPPGMSDAKDVAENRAMVQSGIQALRQLARVMNALCINPKRALEELNRDWTASQELADQLMRDYHLPFRVGHHFASQIVTLARTKAWGPLDFPYEEAQRIYKNVASEFALDEQLPLTAAAFRAALDPVAIVRNRATSGGPQHSEMQRMLAQAQEMLLKQYAWEKNECKRIRDGLDLLDLDFSRLLCDG